MDEVMCLVRKANGRGQQVRLTVKTKGRLCRYVRVSMPWNTVRFSPGVNCAKEFVRAESQRNHHTGHTLVLQLPKVYIAIPVSPPTPQQMMSCFGFSLFCLDNSNFKGCGWEKFNSNHTHGKRVMTLSCRDWLRTCYIKMSARGRSWRKKRMRWKLCKYNIHR